MITHLISSPSELLAGRNFCGLIPQVNPIQIERDMEDMVQRSEKIYPDLNNPKSKFILIPEGTSMMTYNHTKKFWIPGTIERLLGDDVSYMVRLSDGTLVNRNRVDLKMSKIPFKCREKPTLPIPSHAPMSQIQLDRKVVVKSSPIKSKNTLRQKETNVKLNVKSGVTTRYGHKIRAPVRFPEFGKKQNKDCEMDTNPEFKT